MVQPWCWNSFDPVLDYFLAVPLGQSYKALPSILLTKAVSYCSLCLWHLCLHWWHLWCLHFHCNKPKLNADEVWLGDIVVVVVIVVVVIVVVIVVICGL